MIATKTHAAKYCRDDIRTIENYESAMADIEHVWVCHHRLELETLPDGRVIRRTVAQLKACNHYYDRPACELIFLRADVHKKLHMSGNKYFAGKLHTEDCKDHIREVMTGRIVTWGDAISKGKCGKHPSFSEEDLEKRRQRLVTYNKIRVFSEETRKKMSESIKKAYREGRLVPGNQFTRGK